VAFAEIIFKVWQFGNLNPKRWHIGQKAVSCVDACCTVVPINIRGEFFMSTLKDWIGINLNNTNNITNRGLWCDFWALTCYCFWSWKNKEAHDPHFIRPVNAIQHVFKMGGAYKEAMHVKICRTVLPVSNFVKLNTDRASKDGKIAGCGGVIRGSQGEWLGGFAKHIDNCSAFATEL
jgi:hypothetical protein